MSKKYPGGIIRGTPVVPAGPFQDSAAPGIWTLEQATNYIRQGIWPTAGNINPDLFIENLFSTWLYTGNGSTQTINNGIDLAGRGGLVWLKTRTDALAMENFLFDTQRGANAKLSSNYPDFQINQANSLTSFTANGFILGSNATGPNISAANYASWTFRKQPKFFDIVTFSSNGTTGVNIPHSLGSTPGCILLKGTNINDDWLVYHRSTGLGKALKLNTTGAVLTQANYWVSVTDTTFCSDFANGVSGGTWVAYLFAHNAGGFGATGADNVISCGSFTTDGSGNATVTLGYEPQWVLIKRTDGVDSWLLRDVMRGWSNGGRVNLFANLADAENLGGGTASPNATGFTHQANANATYIYIAIRRGPMRTPTSGTQVFTPIARNNGTSPVTTNFTVDLLTSTYRDVSTGFYWTDRLRGGGRALLSFGSNAESTSNASTLLQSNIGYSPQASPNTWFWSSGGTTLGVDYSFRRAPGFFDVVCYNGLRAINDTTPQAVSHNLGVAPELVIVKCRSSAIISFTATNWSVCTILNGVYSNRGYLNTDESFGFGNNINPPDGGSVSASNITFGYGDAATNASGQTYVAYLFASCPGVSKVGSYTGTGATQTINCGFAAGARFVLIKRTNGTGDWYVWDTARGIVAGNDPYLRLNSTAAEVTGTDWVDTAASGFELSNAAGNLVNTNGGSYIFLAIA